MYHSMAVLFAISFLFCYVLVPVFERFALSKGLITGHSPQKLDTRRIPYLGGPAMFLVFIFVNLLGMSLFFHTKYKFLIFLVSVGMIVFFGLYDDLKEISPLKKMAGQCLAALLLISTGLRTHLVFLNPILNMLITLLWIIVITNALNLLDILDGLAATVSLINIIAFLFFGIITGNKFIMLTAPCMIGVVLGFLRYNFPPAKIFMGDAGSQFLGFVQAVMAVSLSFAPQGHEMNLVVPLVVLSVPILDMIFLILMRVRQKKSIFLKSNDHFVFRMLSMGISKKTILKIMVIISLFTNICAVLIFKVSNILGGIVFLILMCGLFIFGYKLSRLEIMK